MAQEFPTILPSHIDTSKHFWSAFGHHKTEVSANCIVRFCKDRDDTWSPFTLNELIGWLEGTGGPAEFCFYRLVGGCINKCEIEIVDEVGNRVGWGSSSSPGVKFHISDSFIRACFKSAGVFVRPEDQAAKTPWPTTFPGPGHEGIA